ncbi:MAG: OmpA family protein [Alistipes sp.]|nr:OmpA family protein [Alistipes sp.]
MQKIYETLKDLIGPELVSKAASTLGESNAKVSTAVSAIIPSLLGKMLKEGNTGPIREAIETAGKNDVYKNLKGIFSGNCIYNNINVGEKFQNAVLGNKSSEFVSAIAAKAGIPTANAGKLTNYVSAAIAGYLGDRMVNHNDSCADIFNELESEKPKIMADIPSNIYSILGLSPVLGNKETVREPEKKNNGWIIWLIICLLLLLLLWFWWRSCNRNRVEQNRANHIERVEPQPEREVAVVHQDNNNDRVRTEITLPDGKTINVYRRGAEERMVNYLNSDAYKNASEDDLKDRWFEFDNIEFEFASADELTAGSEEQLRNIAQILKSYPDAKVRIGGYADKVGSDPSNMELSKRRAEFIKSYFEKQGVNGSRIDTRGFGEEYAKYPANAPDSLRAKDRDIALRLVK